MKTFLSAVAILAGSTISVFSCSCGPAPLEKHVMQADVIFTGIIEKMENQKRSIEVNGHTLLWDYVKVTFLTTRVLKGDLKVGDSISVYSGACGVFFDFYEGYLVYAWDFQSEFTTSQCSNTKSLTPRHRTGRHAARYMRELKEELDLVEFLVEEATKE